MTTSNERVTITVAEVREWVEAQPEGSVVAYCRDTEGCIIANALKAKYPGQRFSVIPFINHIDVGYQDGPDLVFDFRYHLWADSEGRELCHLANDFDNLDAEFEGPVTREEAMTLFEKE